MTSGTFTFNMEGKKYETLEEEPAPAYEAAVGKWAVLCIMFPVLSTTPCLQLGIIYTAGHTLFLIESGY